MRVKVNKLWATVDASEAQLRELYNFFSVEISHARMNPRWNKAIKYGAWDGRQHYFNRISGRMPSGLVPLIPSHLKPEIIYSEEDDGSFGIDETIKLVERARVDLRLKGVELSDFQRETICRFIELKKGIAWLATNAGKTEIAAGVVSILRIPTLYLIHRKTLLHQTAKRIYGRTGIRCNKIGDGFNESFDNRFLTIGMTQSLPKPVKKNQAFYDQFKMIIIDEAQHASANTWYKIAMKCDAPYRLALTGTPFTGKDDKDLRLLACTSAQIILRVRNQELIEKGWSAKPTVHMWPSQYRENNFSWRMARESMIVDNSKYNEMIVQIAKQNWEGGKTTLILVDIIKHGSRITQRLAAEKIDAKFLTGAADSPYREKVLNQFRSGKLGVVIATSILDEGVDVPAIKSLILAGGGKSAIRTLQRVGRALRKKHDVNMADIHDFVHFGNYYLMEHSQQRIDLYKEEGFEIIWEKEIEVET